LKVIKAIIIINEHYERNQSEGTFRLLQVYMHTQVDLFCFQNEERKPSERIIRRSQVFISQRVDLLGCESSKRVLQNRQPNVPYVRTLVQRTITKPHKKTYTKL